MPSLLVVFESRYGQSAKIADHIADLGQRRGIDARAVRVEIARQIATYDGIVVVAPVYFGRHPRVLERFVRHHLPRFDRRPYALVSVSASGAGTSPGARARAELYAERFAERTRRGADVVVNIGGAIAFPRYGLFTRLLMALIHRRDTRDRSRIHELTNWETLDAALQPFLDRMDVRRAAVAEPLPPSSERGTPCVETPDSRPTAGESRAG